LKKLLFFKGLFVVVWLFASR